MYEPVVLPSEGATEDQIDDGMLALLQAEFSGEVYLQTPLVTAAGAGVAVFLGTPDVELTDSRVFPSIFLEGEHSVDPERATNYTRRETYNSDTGKWETRRAPEPYTGSYVVHAYARDEATLASINSQLKEVFYRRTPVPANDKLWYGTRATGLEGKDLYSDQKVFHSWFVFQVAYTHLPSRVLEEVPAVLEAVVEFDTL